MTGDQDGSQVPWHRSPVVLDLMELDAAGALGGIRAIIAERLARLRNGLVYEYPVGMALLVIQSVPVASAPGSPRHRQLLAEAAALLATEVDRLGSPV